MAEVPPSLVLGQVTDVKITDRGLLARLQRLDRAKGTKTDWLAVAGPMAGPQVGTLFAPEVGDLAVAAFAAKDPVILGFLTGGRSGAATDDVNERTIASRDNNKIILIDGDRSGITLRDRHENEIVMNADGITIKTQGALTLEASDTCAVKGSTVELN